jgi:hypothetical protein
LFRALDPSETIPSRVQRKELGTQPLPFGLAGNGFERIYNTDFTETARILSFPWILQIEVAPV